MPDAAIEIVDLVRTFRDGDVRALDGVTITVPPGQVFGLLGPNGSGKTTMIRILSTIIAPTSGRASVNGYDVVREPDEVRRSIGLAGQYAAVDENLTGFENLRMVGRLNHLDKPFVVRRSRELLEHFGLSDAADRPVKGYSGGMRRRLDLAAALVAEPPLVFLDEPTTGLDIQSRQDLWGIIEGLVSSGTTVLLTTQYLEEADRLAHQLVVLDHGRVIAEGTSAELKSRLGETVLSLTFGSPDDAARGADLVARMGDVPPVVDGTTVEVTTSDGAVTATEALRAIDGGGVTLVGLTLREPSLDDVFLSLTGHKIVDEPVAEPARRRRRG